MYTKKRDGLITKLTVNAGNASKNVPDGVQRLEVVEAVMGRVGVMRLVIRVFRGRQNGRRITGVVVSDVDSGVRVRVVYVGVNVREVGLEVVETAVMTGERLSNGPVQVLQLVIVFFDDLPVKSSFGYAIRIVSIEGGCI